MKILLLIVHLADGWSGAELVAPGIEELERSLPSVRLVQSGEGWLSGAGEWTGEDPEIAVVTGLYWGACIQNTLASLEDSDLIIVPTHLILHSTEGTLEEHLADLSLEERLEYIQGSSAFYHFDGRLLWRGRTLFIYPSRESTGSSPSLDGESP